ncbi:uncharacterized protein LOC132725015 [Ruditapes philippinarum]|uniref:uncharacterized protein LOC132725015 n=1 Tax=Ruditapes philippinarum TaxID=129788 RepID=UPI00295A7DC4|nr:uncharacterized protein LOC132725015 [Ruditapes philippinarum]
MITLVCRVTVKSDIQVPSNTCMLVPVRILRHQMLPEVAFISETKGEQIDEVKIINGLLDPHQIEAFIGVMNESEAVYTLKSGQEIGQCYPTQEVSGDMDFDNDKTLTCAAIMYSGSKDQVKAKEDILPDHIKSMFDKGKEHLEESDKEKIATLLYKYQDVFSKGSDDLGCTNMVKHKINTGSSPPIRQSVRRQPYGKRDTEAEEVNKMLDRGIIEPSNSPWSSPIVLVSKKDDSTRFLH